jgi:hypothetical protein
LRGRFPVHAGVVNGVVRLLVEEGGIKPKNIHVYESCAKNFGEDDRPPLFATPFADTKNREPGVVYSHLDAPMGKDMPNASYSDVVELNAGTDQAWEKTFHFWDALGKDTDILINIPALKRHIGGFFMTSMTLSMKNHFGSIRNASKLHGLGIATNIAAVNMAKPIRDKQRLIVVDALYSMYTRGPTHGRMKYGLNKLIVGRDTVAIDYVGWGMLNSIAKQQHEAARPKRTAAYRPFGMPREITIAANNGLGRRAAKWQDHVSEIDLTA